MSSDVTKPSSGSPIAPPAVAVPCQLIGAEDKLIDPEFGFEACTVGIAINAPPNNARTQTNVINTPSELSARQDMNWQNSDELRFAVRFIDGQLLWSGENTGGKDAPDDRATKG
jgi:hypothetical protein